MASPPVTEPERRARLLQAKLVTLVHGHQTCTDPVVGGHAGAATLRCGGTGWFLADDRPVQSLGAALAWSYRQGLEDLHVVVDDPLVAGVLARRAQHVDHPPLVWSCEGRTLHRAHPAEHQPAVLPGPGTESMVVLLADAGAEVVIEHGVITGEVLGLEVARVVTGDGVEARLEVGVGRHDREAFALMHGEVPPAEAVAAAVGAVRAVRHPASGPHPLAELAAQRWLRALVVADPGLVGATHLAFVDPIEPRGSVGQVVAACALGADARGAPVLAACSVGVDLDLVVEAADVYHRHYETAPGSITVVVPERDAHPLLGDLASGLRQDCRVVTVPAGWRSGSLR